MGVRWVLSVFLFSLIFTNFSGGPRSLWAQRAAYVNPHVRMDGTYVPGFYPNDPRRNVFIETQPTPIRNPYTGQLNTKLWPHTGYDINHQTSYDPFYYMDSNWMRR